jgi:hypothetical protein
MLAEGPQQKMIFVRLANLAGVRQPPYIDLFIERLARRGRLVIICHLQFTRYEAVSQAGSVGRKVRNTDKGEYTPAADGQLRRLHDGRPLAVRLPDRRRSTHPFSFDPGPVNSPEQQPAPQILHSHDRSQRFNTHDP